MILTFSKNVMLAVFLTLSIIKKCTSSIKVLPYDAATDSCDEYCSLGKSITMEVFYETL
jgi:hypothetical protein